jgi:hypothetical protein
MKTEQHPVFFPILVAVMLGVITYYQPLLAFEDWLVSGAPATYHYEATP